MDIVRVEDPHGEGLFRLVQGFLAEIGEPALDAAGEERITAAIAEDRIRFFAASESGEFVGCCSLTTGYSTFGGGAPFGLIEDFFVAREHRGTGIARRMVDHLLGDAEKLGCSSVVLGCSDGDVPMYRHLGFTEKLGTMLSAVLPAAAGTPSDLAGEQPA